MKKPVGAQRQRRVIDVGPGRVDGGSLMAGKVRCSGLDVEGCPMEPRIGRCSSVGSY